MARIVYGVAGEGSGHASRAAEVLAHLVGQGHEVKVASYDRGHRDLSGRFDVLEIEGLSIKSSNNRISAVRTFTQNLGKVAGGLRSLRAAKRELFDGFQPDVAITDFEPMTAHLARHFGVPLVTIDNQHRMRYMACPCPGGLRKDALITHNVIRALVPKPDVSLVLTFFFGALLNRRTFLYPPILRSEVLALRPTRGEHILVYFTQGFDRALAMLQRFPRERFVVYGYEREGEDGNIVFKPHSSAGFLDDLASAKAVLATAGFTLMSEALHLGKPLLALPMRGQFEQELNALLVEEAGYGRNGRKLTPEAIGDFLYRLPEYEAKLGAHLRSDNSALFAKVDALVADGAALAREMHARRGELGRSAT